MTEEKKLFLVWYDPELNQIMNIEKEHATEPLLNQLKKENIEISEIYEENLKKANEVFVKNIEKMKPSIHMMTAHSDISPTSIVQETKEEYFDLDKKLDEIEGNKPKANLKLH